MHDEQRYRGLAVVSSDTLADLIQRMLSIEDFLKDAEERISKVETLYEVEVQPGVHLWQLLFDSEGYISRDLALQLNLAIDRAATIDVQGIAAAQPVGALGLFDQTQHSRIDSKADLMNLFREDLCINPGSSQQFYDRCELAFPRLEFSSAFPNCLDTFEDGHHRFVSLLVSCFSALNDTWHFADGQDLKEYLRSFSSSSRFETTLEGNGERKSAFTFEFYSGEPNAEKVVCEPHMKISATDQKGDTEHRFHRIYFSPRLLEKNGRRVLVGHAGKHL